MDGRDFVLVMRDRVDETAPNYDLFRTSLILIEEKRDS